MLCLFFPPPPSSGEVFPFFFYDVSLFFAFFRACSLRVSEEPAQLLRIPRFVRCSAGTGTSSLRQSPRVPEMSLCGNNNHNNSYAMVRSRSLGKNSVASVRCPVLLASCCAVHAVSKKYDPVPGHPPLVLPATGVSPLASPAAPANRAKRHVPFRLAVHTSLSCSYDPCRLRGRFVWNVSLAILLAATTFASLCTCIMGAFCGARLTVAGLSPETSCVFPSTYLLGGGLEETRVSVCARALWLLISNNAPQHGSRACQAQW